MTKIQIPQEIKPLLRDLSIFGEKPRIVGGAVRDLLLGRKPRDWDIITRADIRLVAAILQARGYSCSAPNYGGIKVKKGVIEAEITRLRVDTYTQKRFPQIKPTASFKKDAERRDFTFNALSATPDGRVYDYLGGLADLRAEKVRFIGDRARKIAEDPSRAERETRFILLFQQRREAR